jgi:histidine ammonia-lyase
VDTVPTSAGQEDHVSMATHAGAKARRIAGNAAGVVGIELLAAAQGIEFHRPLRTSPPLEQALDTIRAAVPVYESDRYMADDLAWAQRAVAQGAFAAAGPALL